MDENAYRPPSPEELRRVLEQTKTLAVVGASSNPVRPSHGVASYLLGSSEYTVWFVNPRETEILGRPVYPSLGDLPEVPDLVDVFRRAEELPGVADEAVAVGAKTYWAQLGLYSAEAARIALAGGLEVVMNRCIKVEHARLMGTAAGSPSSHPA